MPEAL
ncbi:uncharacterized protein FFMR_12184 [Fusarium fujikuroi]